MKPANHYEFLQISSNAEPDTIHRVFRFLAQRFHPDNPVTGDSDRFSELKAAYDVLSDPKLRAEYDAGFAKDVPEPDPLSTSLDFMDDLEGELNRRLAVLALLYIRRRISPENPEVTLYEVEKRMGFPRDYLDFTLWYLQKKKYITRTDNSAFTLMAEGVDFVETQRVAMPVLNRLLTSGAGGASSAPIPVAEAKAAEPAHVQPIRPIVVPVVPVAPVAPVQKDRRRGDRRKPAQEEAIA